MPPKAGINVSLTKQLKRFINSRVKSGQYGSASEVVRTSLRLLQKQEKQNERHQAWKADIRKKIDEGLAQLRRGEGVDARMALDRVEREVFGGATRRQRRKSA